MFRTLLLFGLLILISAANDYEFGFKTYSSQNSQSNGQFAVSFYNYPNMYQCIIIPNVGDQLFICDDIIECISPHPFEPQYGMEIVAINYKGDQLNIASLYIKNTLNGEITIITSSNPSETIHSPQRRLLYSFSKPNGIQQIATVTRDSNANIAECLTPIPTSNPSLRPTPLPSITPTQSPSAECPPPQCETNTPLDIAILIDESGSINDNEYDVMIQFIERFITYDMNDYSYLSLFGFSDTSDFKQIIDFTVLDTNGRSQIINSLNNNQQSKGNTYTGDAIKRTLDEFDINNDRTDILFVLTDGDANDIPCDIVSDLDIGSIEIVLIGVGNNIDKSILMNDNYNCLYDCPYNDIFIIPEFDENAFIDKEYELRIKTCQESTCQEPQTSTTNLIGFGAFNGGNDAYIWLKNENDLLKLQLSQLYAVFVILILLILLCFAMTGYVIYKNKKSNEWIKYKPVDQCKANDDV